MNTCCWTPPAGAAFILLGTGCGAGSVLASVPDCLQQFVPAPCHGPEPAYAGMISKRQVAAIEARGWDCILGARLRATKEVRVTVLADPGRFETVEAGRQRSDPMELHVKEVRVDGNGKAPRRCVVCRNPEQVAKDAATRAELLAALEGMFRSGAKCLIANKGFRSSGPASCAT